MMLLVISSAVIEPSECSRFLLVVDFPELCGMFLDITPRPSSIPKVHLTLLHQQVFHQSFLSSTVLEFCITLKPLTLDSSNTCEG